MALIEDLNDQTPVGSTNSLATGLGSSYWSSVPLGSGILTDPYESVVRYHCWQVALKRCNGRRKRVCRGVGPTRQVRSRTLASPEPAETEQYSSYTINAPVPGSGTLDRSGQVVQRPGDGGNLHAHQVREPGIDGVGLETGAVPLKMPAVVMSSVTTVPSAR